MIFHLFNNRETASKTFRSARSSQNMEYIKVLIFNFGDYESQVNLDALLAKVFEYKQNYLYFPCPSEATEAKIDNVIMNLLLFGLLPFALSLNSIIPSLQLVNSKFKSRLSRSYICGSHFMKGKIVNIKFEHRLYVELE